MSQTAALPRLGVLFSGGGRTVENLARKVVEGALPVEIAAAVSSHRDAGGIARARAAGIETHVVDYREHKDDFSQRIVQILAAARVDWLALAGFIRFFDIPESLKGRVLNIHPALLPAFGGRGFYGKRVHRAALEAGVKFSGCTVHFVDDQYDHGPIILQRVVPVERQDTVETLADRVFQEECVAYPEALRLCIAGQVVVEDGRAVFS